MNTQNIDTNANRHIRNARTFVKGLSGYERAEKITEYFENNGHPHAMFTFNQMAMNRASDAQFANDIIKEMAYLVAENEMLAA